MPKNDFGRRLNARAPRSSMSVGGSSFRAAPPLLLHQQASQQPPGDGRPGWKPLRFALAFPSADDREDDIEALVAAVADMELRPWMSKREKDKEEPEKKVKPDKTESVRQLWNLALNPANHAAFWQALLVGGSDHKQQIPGPIISVLTNLLTAPDAELKYVTVGCIQQLLGTDMFCVPFAPAIPALLALLTARHDRSKYAAAACLRLLAAARHAAIVTRLAPELPALVAVLTTTDVWPDIDQAKEHLAVAVCELAVFREPRERMLAAGALAALRPHLTSGGADCRLAVVTAVHELTKDGPWQQGCGAARSTIIACGYVRPLVELLYTFVTNLRTLAAQALYVLAMREGHLKTITMELREAADRFQRGELRPFARQTGSRRRSQMSHVAGAGASSSGAGATSALGGSGTGTRSRTPPAPPPRRGLSKPGAGGSPSTRTAESSPPTVSRSPSPTLGGAGGGGLRLGENSDLAKAEVALRQLLSLPGGGAGGHGLSEGFEAFDVATRDLFQGAGAGGVSSGTQGWDSAMSRADSVSRRRNSVLTSAADDTGVSLRAPHRVSLNPQLTAAAAVAVGSDLASVTDGGATSAVAGAVFVPGLTPKGSSKPTPFTGGREMPTLGASSSGRLTPAAAGGTWRGVSADDGSTEPPPDPATYNWQKELEITTLGPPPAEIPVQYVFDQSALETARHKEGARLSREHERAQAKGERFFRSKLEEQRWAEHMAAEREAQRRAEALKVEVRRNASVAAAIAQRRKSNMHMAARQKRIEERARAHQAGVAPRNGWIPVRGVRRVGGTGGAGGGGVWAPRDNTAQLEVRDMQLPPLTPAAWQAPTPEQAARFRFEMRSFTPLTNARALRACSPPSCRTPDPEPWSLTYASYGQYGSYYGAPDADVDEEVGGQPSGRLWLPSAPSWRTELLSRGAGLGASRSELWSRGDRMDATTPPPGLEREPSTGLAVVGDRSQLFPSHSAGVLEPVPVWATRLSLRQRRLSLATSQFPVAQGMLMSREAMRERAMQEPRIILEASAAATVGRRGAADEATRMRSQAGSPPLAAPPVRSILRQPTEPLPSLATGEAATAPVPAAPERLKRVVTLDPVAQAGPRGAFRPSADPLLTSSFSPAITAHMHAMEMQTTPQMAEPSQDMEASTEPEAGAPSLSAANSIDGAPLVVSTGGVGEASCRTETTFTSYISPLDSPRTEATETEETAAAAPLPPSLEVDDAFAGQLSAPSAQDAELPLLPAAEPLAPGAPDAEELPAMASILSPEEDVSTATKDAALTLAENLWAMLQAHALIDVAATGTGASGLLTARSGRSGRAHSSSSDGVQEAGSDWTASTDSKLSRVDTAEEAEAAADIDADARVLAEEYEAAGAVAVSFLRAQMLAAASEVWGLGSIDALRIALAPSAGSLMRHIASQRSSSTESPPITPSGSRRGSRVTTLPGPWHDLTLVTPLLEVAAGNHGMEAEVALPLDSLIE